MDTLSLPLSEMVVDYFDRFAPFDYMDLDYATQLSRDGCVDACTLLVAMVYIDRVRNMDRCYFEESDPSELYLSALVVASKYLQDGGLDEFVYNDEWGLAASTSTRRVNELEVCFLNVLTWDANVNENEFLRTLESAEQWVARRHVRRYGFCTYNEVTALSQRISSVEWRKVLESFAFACVAIGTVYVASVVVLHSLVQLTRTKHVTSETPLFVNHTAAAIPNRNSSLLQLHLESLVTEQRYCYPLCDTGSRENVTSLRDRRIILQNHLRLPLALRSQ